MPMSLYRPSYTSPYMQNARKLVQAAKGARKVYQQYQSNKRRRSDARAPPPPTRRGILTRVNNATRTAIKSKQKFKRKSRKSVKVSRSLRKKVNHVIESHDSVIKGHLISNARITGEKTTIDNLKSYTMLPWGKDVNGNDNSRASSGELFTWNRINYAASRCFMNRAQTEFPKITDANSFGKTTKIDVQSQSAKYWIRNNTNRTYFVSMFKLTSRDNQEGLENFLSQWNEAMTNDIGRTTGFSKILTGGVRILSTQWPNHPKRFEQMKSSWKIEEIKMVIEPGQSVEQTVIGPAITYDGLKYYNDQIYQDYHKGAVYTMFSYLPDVVQFGGNNTIGQPGYWFGGTNPAVTVEGSLTFEVALNYRFSMPEPTGFILGTVPIGGTQDLGLRKDFTVFEDYVNPAPIGENTYLRRDAVEPSDVTIW